MSIPSLIPADRVISESSAASKRALLTDMAAALPTMDPDLVLEVVMAREQLGSTGIGHGVAIPHGRMPDLTTPIVVLARHRQGIDFDAIDGKPVHIVIMLLVPDNEDRTHLELLARLARLLQKEDFRQRIMDADDVQAVSQLFEGEAANP